MGYFLKLTPMFLLSASYGNSPEDGCFGVAYGLIREGESLDRAANGFLRVTGTVEGDQVLRDGLAVVLATWLSFFARRDEWRRRNSGRALCPECAGLGHAMSPGDMDTRPCACGAKPQNPHRFPVAFSFPAGGVPQEVVEELALQPGVEVLDLPGVTSILAQSD